MSLDMGLHPYILHALHLGKGFLSATLQCGHFIVKVLTFEFN